MKNRIAVVYLSWLPYGITYFKEFLNSYTKHPSQTPHELVILFNGYVKSGDVTPYLELLSDSGLNPSLYYLKEGYDIDAYFFVAAKLKHDYVLFLNTYSRILYSGWLDIYVKHFKGNVGLMGATASWQSLFNTWASRANLVYESQKGLLHNFRKFKLFIKTFFFRRFFLVPFPNPHVRTNAFMIRRELFLQAHRRRIRSKYDAYLFENGKKSLTRQVLAWGFDVLVVDCRGNSYQANQWPQSKTFWISEQENLLIEDNQTDLYKMSGPHRRQILTKMAWGI
jgi:hypothetical protein